MKYENQNIEVGTEKTIFKEKEANFIDNIGTLEKKNQLYEERVFFIFYFHKIIIHDLDQKN